MSYITKKFYDETFVGTEIPNSEFERLAGIASDVIYDVCIIKPTENELANEVFQKAVCYQTEMLYLQGGIDAITGFSESSQRAGSESLGDYSVGGAGNGSVAISGTIGGIPVSQMAIGQLRRLGLMSRWAYAECYRGK